MGNDQAVCRYACPPQRKRRREYDPYGKIVNASVNPQIKYLFTNQEMESDISSASFWNFRARAYDSEIGMFYAPDPAKDTYSPFGYVGGNPISFIDPTGKQTAAIPFDYTTANMELMRQSQGAAGGSWGYVDVGIGGFGGPGMTYLEGTWVPSYSVSSTAVTTSRPAFIYYNGKYVGVGTATSDGITVMNRITLSAGHLEGGWGNPELPSYDPGVWVVDRIYNVTWTENWSYPARPIDIDYTNGYPLTRIRDPKSGFTKAYELGKNDCSSFSCYVMNIPKTNTAGIKETYKEVPYDRNNWQIVTWGPYQGENGMVYHSGVTYGGNFWHVQTSLTGRGSRNLFGERGFVEYMRGKGRGEPSYYEPR